MNFIFGIARYKTLTWMMAVIALLAAGSVWSLTPGEQRILERIAPVGNVCIAGEECVGAATVVVEGTSGSFRSGSDVYTSKCFACHDTGAAGAPKMGDVAVWTSRVNDKGLESLIANAINGIGAMPAKGTCVDCSDDEIAASVEYIIANSQ